MGEHNTPPDPKGACSCMHGNFFFSNFQTTHLGGDSLDGEVNLMICKQCGSHWLSVFYEPQIHDDAAAWYRGLIRAEDIHSITQGEATILKNALEFLESLDWYYCGGTYWLDAGGRPVPFKSSGKIILR